ncbi:MAG: hypothetical protein IJH86_06255 [Clostridia bacterium]|nr:hypothetical protein [Clostridia bacterium]
MNRALRAQIRAAFSYPEPTRKRAFLRKLRPPGVGMIEMVLTQAAYIRGRVWVAAGAALIPALLGAFRLPGNAARLMGALLPFSAGIAVLETRRSRDYSMAELERATRFSLRSVVFARMLAIGAVDLGVILLSAAALSARSGLPVPRTTAEISAPFLAAAWAGLYIERTPLGRRHGHLSMAASALISALALGGEDVGLSLSALPSGAWMAASGALAVLTAREVCITLSRTEEWA